MAAYLVPSLFVWDVTGTAARRSLYSIRRPLMKWGHTLRLWMGIFDSCRGQNRQAPAPRPTDRSLRTPLPFGFISEFRTFSFYPIHFSFAGIHLWRSGAHSITAGTLTPPTETGSSGHFQEILHCSWLLLVVDTDSR